MFPVVDGHALNIEKPIVASNLTVRLESVGENLLEPLDVPTR